MDSTIDWEMCIGREIMGEGYRKKKTEREREGEGEEEGEGEGERWRRTRRAVTTDISNNHRESYGKVGT